MKIAIRATFVVLALGIAFLTSPSLIEGKSDKEIKRILIRESIASYTGSCPCPYNTTRNGRRCGRRSAYSRPGGASPLCYEHDVTDAMVKAYRKKNDRKKNEKK